MNETRDVVVVGAGPVGLMLACELRLAGVDVLVVERLAEPDMTLKAGAINVPTAQALSRRGLLPQMREHQEAFFEAMARFRAAAAPSAGPMRQVGGHFAGLMVHLDQVDLDDRVFADLGPAAQTRFVDQQGIEAMLAQRAGELGVPVRRGVQVTDFTDDGVGVTITCGERTVRAGWLVGCDGGRSSIRKQAGFDFPGLDPLITGRQAVVEMTGAEHVAPGWHTSPHGLYVFGPTPGRFLTVEVDGPPTDRDAPITARELEDSFTLATGAKVHISKVLSATRFTDNTRQVTNYRRGRVLLAGDAAHVHSPFGGQGLNLGIGDAVNLGWKLAAVIRGRADLNLLDTYTTERHPIGAWVLDWTRAQITLMRTDERSRALRAVTAELLHTRDGATLIFKKIAGILHHYDVSDAHPRSGYPAPDLELADGTQLGEHFTTGNGLLLDFTDSPARRAATARRPTDIPVLTIKSAEPQKFSALLIRPDGIVAWASDDDTDDGLTTALDRWFGPAT